MKIPSTYSTLPQGVLERFTPEPKSGLEKTFGGILKGVGSLLESKLGAFSGIDPEYQDRMFDIFWQLQPALASSSNGVGLSIVKRIVQDHGGDIRVRSRAGDGAIFYFTISKKLEDSCARGKRMDPGLQQ